MKYFKLAYNSIGMPSTWLVLMMLVLAIDTVTGFTLKGTFFMTICLFSFHLSRIAEAVEKK